MGNISKFLNLYMDKFRRLKEWIINNDGKINGLELFESENGYGLICTRDIYEGDILLNIPSKLFIDGQLLSSYNLSSNAKTIGHLLIELNKEYKNRERLWLF